MPPQDADVVRAMYAAFSQLADGGDIEKYVATHFTPACEYFPVEELEPIRGHDALASWNRRWLEAWDVFKAHVQELRESDGAVVAHVQVEGRGGASGMSLAQPFFHVIEVRDGRIASMREYMERDEALRVAGLS